MGTRRVPRDREWLYWIVRGCRRLFDSLFFTFTFFYFTLFFTLSRLLYLAFPANLGLLCMPHPGMGPLV